MEKPEKWPLPQWCESEEDMLRFYVKLAALFDNRDGSLRALSTGMGYSHATISVLLADGRITPETSIQIEKRLGRELFPRELFRPDLFRLPE